MMKALFVIELAALVYSLSLVFSCNSARGEAMNDLVAGALGEKDRNAVVKYGNLEPLKIECSLDGEVHLICPNPYVVGVLRDEDSRGERQSHQR